MSAPLPRRDPQWEAEMLEVVADPAAGPRPVTSLHARRGLLAPPAEQLRLLAEQNVTDLRGRPARFEEIAAPSGHDPLKSAKLEIFQVNLGKLCNMTCRHCHVDAGPDRTDAMMSDDTAQRVIEAMERSGAHTVDITGGAPELHPRFRDLVVAAKRLGMHVMDRCNLTILLVPRFRDLCAWLAEHEVEVVASLPHCRKLNTDAQRGDGTFEKSIEALQRLNAVGYGQGDPRRRLTLVSNPAGAFLAGDQAAMEREWRTGLQKDFGVSFDRLFALNNMPISRYLEWLYEKGQLERYMQLLVDSFNPTAVEGLMCRNTVSVSWDGRVYDCDFNQMLDLESEGREGGPLPLSALDAGSFPGRTIRTDRHCFGCTAGSGSSCGGATT